MQYTQFLHSAINVQYISNAHRYAHISLNIVHPPFASLNFEHYALNFYHSSGDVYSFISICISVMKSFYFKTQVISCLSVFFLRITQLVQHMLLYSTIIAQLLVHDHFLLKIMYSLIQKFILNYNGVKFSLIIMKLVIE